ncbi:MAG: hypothetical protein Q9172_006535 [Xanthocarpia lactea]
MDWTPSSSTKKRKYHEYCDTFSLPAQPHIPGEYPQSPVSHADFGREMYLGSPTPETRAVYQGVSAPSHTSMRLNPDVPESLRSFMHMVASAATTARTCSTYTVGLLAGPGGRFGRCLKHNAGHVWEAIGNTAKRVKLTIRPQPNPSAATEPPSTPPSRRISNNLNVSPSAPLPSQTSVLHNARETGLRRVRNMLRWLGDQQQLYEASHQMLERNAAQPFVDTTNAGNFVDTIAHTGPSSAQDPLTLRAATRTQIDGSTAPLGTDGSRVFNDAAPFIDINASDDSVGLEAFRDMDCDVNVQIASYLAAESDSVHSSDLDGLSEEDLIGLETKEEKRERMAQVYLEEMKALEAEQQAERSKVKGVFPNPDLFAEKLRMVYDTAASPKPPKKSVAFYDSSNNGNPVTLVKSFNHDDPMTPPYRRHVPTDKVGLAPALRRHNAPIVQDVPIGVDVPLVQEGPVALDEQPSPSGTPPWVNDSGDTVAAIPISDAGLATSDDDDTSTSPSGSVASLSAVCSNLTVLGFSSRQSTKRLSDLDALEQIKREAEAALAAEEAAQLAKEAAEERSRLGIRRLPVSPVIEPLTAGWDDRLAEAMRTGVSSSKCLATTSTGEALRRRDFGHVLPQPGVDSAMGWLNDTIITAYLQAVVDYAQKSREVRRGDLPKVHAMSTFFYDNLAQRGYDSVKRWATRAKFGGRNLLKMEKIFIPINKGGNHWVLAHVNPQSKTIEYFDSFHHHPGPVFDHIKTWLQQELGDAFTDSEWTLSQDGGPRQRNASDCGVFATTTAKMIVLGVDPMAFSAADMPTQRRRMLAELMNGGLHGDFTPNITF